MKKFFLALLLFVSFACSGPKPQPFHIDHPVSWQARTSHMLSFAMKDNTQVDICTGTVIGPHAVMTADHCDSNDQFPKVFLDYSTRPYEILRAEHDDRDHAIYFLDGPAFTEIEPYNVRSPQYGEAVYIYGFGHGQYPAMPKHGVVIREYDPSEINRAQGFVYETMPVIPGDSGSAVYGADGAILGLLTYQIVDGIIFKKEESASFQLAFTPEQIVVAQSATFEKKPPKHQDTEQEELLKIFGDRLGLK